MDKGKLFDGTNEKNFVTSLKKNRRRLCQDPYVKSVTESISCRRKLVTSELDIIEETPESEDSSSDFDFVADTLRSLSLALNDTELTNDQRRSRREKFGNSLSIHAMTRSNRLKRRRIWAYSPYPTVISRHGYSRSATSSKSSPLPYSVDLLCRLSGALDDADFESAFFIGLPRTTTRRFHSQAYNRQVSSASGGDSCSSQARSSDVTVAELAAYFDEFMHLPKKMSHMAEMMYT